MTQLFKPFHITIFYTNGLVPSFKLIFSVAFVEPNDISILFDANKGIYRYCSSIMTRGMLNNPAFYQSTVNDMEDHLRLTFGNETIKNNLEITTNANNADMMILEYDYSEKHYNQTSGFNDFSCFISTTVVFRFLAMNSYLQSKINNIPFRKFVEDVCLKSCSTIKEQIDLFQKIVIFLQDLVHYKRPRHLIMTFIHDNLYVINQLNNPLTPKIYVNQGKMFSTLHHENNQAPDTIYSAICLGDYFYLLSDNQLNYSILDFIGMLKNIIQLYNQK